MLLAEDAAASPLLSQNTTVFFLFLAAAGLAAFAAVAELIGRFRDEPWRVIRTRQGLLYLALNAALAAIVLAALRYASPPNTGLVALEQVLLAGFGARILVRTKVVSARGKEGEEVGPGTFFERLLSSISRTADRDRAAERLQLVTTQLEGVAWEKAYPFFFPELAGAMQDLTDEEKVTIQANLEVIRNDPAFDDSTRVDLLGLLVLNYAGDKFLKTLASLYRQRYGENPSPTIPPQAKGPVGPPMAPPPPDKPSAEPPATPAVTPPDAAASAADLPLQPPPPEGGRGGKLRR